MENIMSNIKLFRLNSGEELIGAVTIKGDGDYFVKDITVLIPTQANSLGLAPFMPYSQIPETGITFKEKDVMFFTEPVEELASKYREMYTKIVTPAQKKIIF
jgi:hypothetical protein